MNRLQLPLLSALLFVVITMSSCEAIAGIFKAGMVTSLVIIAIIVGLVLYFVNRSKK